MTAKAKNSDALAQTLIKAAWWSVLLGLGMQLLLLVAAAFFTGIPALQEIVADTVQKISWSTLVCSGVAVGLAAGKMRAPVMGFAGLVAAPAAFYVAKIAHKSVAQALGIASQVAASAPSPMLLAGLKGLEYAVLGFLIGQLGRRKKVGLKGHMLAGGGVGLGFGGFILYLMVTQAANPIPLGGIVTRGINEMIFPVGCALVLYAAQKVGEHQAHTDRADVETTDAVQPSKED
ncbi:MAG: hypothetical protein ACAH80_00315 [Alphaproteobacteria bacterium]